MGGLILRISLNSISTPTRNPKEVNFYLEYYVGCTASNDKKNYSFSDADSPGVVYIPPANWSPSKNERLKRMVTTALASFPATQMNFQRGGRAINGRSLAIVANLVIDGEIGVVHDTSISPGTAEYDSGDNVFLFNFETAETRTRKALIIHEAVHAFLDWQSDSEILVSDSEALAYVAQCYYMYHHTAEPAASRLTDVNPTDDEVFRLGWLIAEKLHQRKTPDAIEWAALETAVSRHSKYRRTAARKAGFNGT